MKKNLPIIVLCCITIIILIEFFFIQYILKSTRLYPKTEIVLKIEKDNLDEFDLPLNISEDSIEKLYKTINEASLKENTDSLIDVFDKERNFYINFITIISIVLSILGITPVIYGIFEKNENARLQEELENLKNEYDNQLDEIRIQNFFNLIKDKTEAARQAANNEVLERYKENFEDYMKKQYGLTDSDFVLDEVQATQKKVLEEHGAKKIDYGVLGGFEQNLGEDTNPFGSQDIFA